MTLGVTFPEPRSTGRRELGVDNRQWSSRGQPSTCLDSMVFKTANKKMRSKSSEERPRLDISMGISVTYRSVGDESGTDRC